MTSPEPPDGDAPDEARPAAPDEQPPAEASPETPGPETAGPETTSADAPSAAPVEATKRTKLRRSWPQRSLLALNCVVIVACFAGAGGLVLGRHYGNSIARVDLVTPPGATQAPGQPDGDGSSDGPDPTTAGTAGETPSNTQPDETFPIADPSAQNFLITGADNNSCLDPNSPYAPAFGDREGMGERSDTIMIMRVDPDAHRAAVLSFPRDLWVKIDGGGKNRINSAYVRDDPTKLVNTLYDVFGLPVDHFIQVDFCAFKLMVDAVGGVTVPFEYAARDTHTGLNVPQPGCYTFSGEHALAYVRSRHYQYFKDDKWVEDPASDLGRISRQQDFLRRVLASALAKGFNPGVAKGMIKAVEDYVVVDRQLTISRMLEFAGLLNDIDPNSINTYQIDAKNATINGNAVLIPKVDSSSMKAILLMFRGGISLAEAPLPGTTTASTVPGETTTTAVAPTGSTVPEQKPIGVVPPDQAC